MKKSDQELPRYRKVVSLIPGGMMQFLDLGLDIRRLSRVKTEFLEIEVPAFENNVNNKLLKCMTPSDDGEYYLDSQTGEPVVNPLTGLPDKTITPSYSISIEKALAPFLNQWVPLPFFRSAGNIGANEMRYRDGPTDWARAYLEALAEPDRQGNTHHLVIAFDTHIQSDIDVTKVSKEEGYASLAEQDMNDGAELSLVTQFKSYAWFLNLDWMRDWLSDFFEKSLNKQNPRRTIRKSDLEHRHEHLARYIAFIELLGSSDVIPKVKLTDPRRHQDPIDVDLVLDIGNSRTIGMLIEKRPGENLSLDNGSVLELRDLSRPTLTHKETFNSYVCFAKPRFGDPTGYARGSGRYRPSFSWPSVVRVGAEASRLAIHSRREEGQTSMSSPKRYLWDLKPRVQEWRYAPDPNDPTSPETPVNSGDFVGFINNEGTPLSAFESRRTKIIEFIQGQSEFPVTEPKFSRSSMMMFLISEILSHALVQANSPAQRNNRLNPDIPRRLRSIILTTPPAMSVSERMLYEQWANWALDVVWKALEWQDHENAPCDYRSKPKIRMKLDEASATQLVFVYNEIEKRFAGNSTQYMDIFGKPRHRYANKPCLRVASIDIGGGTTDMVITTYLTESAGATNILIPHQEFREGFNVAGDDLLKAIIENHLIPELTTYLASHNPSVNRETIRRRLGQNAVDLTEKDRNLRAQFAQQVLVPMALAVFAKLEKVVMEDLSSYSAYQLALQSVIKDTAGVDPEVLKFIEKLVSPHNDSSFDFLNWQPVFDLADVGTTISATISPYLQSLAEVVKLSDCDFLVVSGRPSCLPSIQAIFLKSPPVQPSRIIAMSEYQVESWYPFWTTLEGKIEDPKTTGVVGALLYTVSEGNLKNFHIRTAALKPASTIKFMGPMGGDKQIRNTLLLFGGQDVSLLKDEELTCTILFQTQTNIGFRQMEVERWKTTPFYQLDFANQNANDKAITKGPYQITLSYIRRFDDDEEEAHSQAENEGVLKIMDILDKDGGSIPKSDLVLSLKSLWDESHWLDTGLFEIN